MNDTQASLAGAKAQLSRPTSARLTDQPDPASMLPTPPGLGRRFMLWVDTEEEFDWSAPFNRASRAVTAIQGMERFQRYISNCGVRPVYVTDHAVADSDAAVALMRGWIAEGSADVGAHLHPWVNPPHEEEVSARNSYAGNLSPVLERAKLFALRDRLTERFGVAPRAFRAGRYGVGTETARFLEEAGFRVDSSVRSRFDYRAQHGPDFSGRPLSPWRAGPNGGLIELPLSTAFLGHLGGAGDRLQPIGQRFSVVNGLFSRLGLLSRVPLTPEGVSAREACAAIDALIAEDVPVLGFSFHSPTLEPGNTPYTPDHQAVEDFYLWWDAVLGHLSRRGVHPLSLDDFITAYGIS